LLCAVGESHWAKWVQDCIERWRATHDTSCHLSLYAGMGSFNDIYICRKNRHIVTELQEPWVNTLLLWLQALCCFLAKQPHNFLRPKVCSIQSEDLMRRSRRLRGETGQTLQSAAWQKRQCSQDGVVVTAAMPRHHIATSKPSLRTIFSLAWSF